MNLRILRIVAVLEGISYLVLLLVAMPAKYYFGIHEATQHVGMAHGVLFVLYVAFVIIVAFIKKWNLMTILILLVLSLIPLGTFYADKKYLKG